jgi:hypothetical protein
VISRATYQGTLCVSALTGKGKELGDVICFGALGYEEHRLRMLKSAQLPIRKAATLDQTDLSRRPERTVLGATRRGAR